jgi:hypothetical protein
MAIPIPSSGGRLISGIHFPFLSSEAGGEGSPSTLNSSFENRFRPTLTSTFGSAMLTKIGSTR